LALSFILKRLALSFILRLVALSFILGLLALNRLTVIESSLSLETYTHSATQMDPSIKHIRLRFALKKIVKFMRNYLPCSSTRSLVAEFNALFGEDIIYSLSWVLYPFWIYFWYMPELWAYNM